MRSHVPTDPTSAPPQPRESLTAHASGNAPTPPRPAVEVPRASSNPRCVLFKRLVMPQGRYVITSRLPPCNASQLQNQTFRGRLVLRQTFQDIMLWQNRYLYVNPRLSFWRKSAALDGWYCIACSPWPHEAYIILQPRSHKLHIPLKRRRYNCWATYSHTR